MLERFDHGLKTRKGAPTNWAGTPARIIKTFVTGLPMEIK
jgi:hypothetical protein